MFGKSGAFSFDKLYRVAYHNFTIFSLSLR